MAEAPLSAEEIAHRGFPSTFRGFDPAEVRAYLVRLAGELNAATARERELKQKLIEAERRAANPVIDEAMLTRALGEETSRVLVSAQEAARQLLARAEDGVARILREAHEQAQRVRAEAEVVLADRTEEADAAAGEIRAAAEAEAAAVVEQARREAEAARAEVVEQSRQLVQEAQAARARVLGDLARRRRIAHTQVEQLRAGRERLLDAYRVVRRTLDEVADELERVESEARSAAGAAARRVEAALHSGDAPAEEVAGGDGASEEPVGLPAGLQGLAMAPAGSAASAGRVDLAPVAPAVVAPHQKEPAAQAPAPEPALAAGAEPSPAPAGEPGPVPRWDPGMSPTRGASPRAEPPVVAREERIEERKLSSLRILRRPKSEPAAGPEQEMVPEVRPEVERVRVIPASPAPARAPAGQVPAPESVLSRGEREPPTIVPGVSWAPAPPVPGPQEAPAPQAEPQPAASAATTAAPSEAVPPPPPPAGASGPGPGSVAAPAVAGQEGPPPAAATDKSSSSTPPPAAAVDALFARIRADRTGTVATSDEVTEAGVARPIGDDPSGPAPVATAAGTAGLGTSSETPVAAESAPPVGAPQPPGQPDQGEPLLQRRDEAVEPIEAALARRLKRALQDEHNDVLDRLRSCKGAPSASAFLPSPVDQAARYATAATELLAEAARSGARFVSADEPEPEPADVADVVADLTEALVGPLRRAAERGVEASQEDPSVLVDTIGAAYRECKTQRLERLAGDATIAAFSRGTVSASSGAVLRWVVDDGDAACPDCDDNALAGPTQSGQQYPTGQSHPPAHAGCRCLLVPGRP